MDSHIPRLALSGMSFQELATSRRSVQRWNDPSGQMFQLFDTERQVLYVTPKTELWNYMSSLNQAVNLPDLDADEGSPARGARAS